MFDSYFYNSITCSQDMNIILKSRSIHIVCIIIITVWPINIELLKTKNIICTMLVYSGQRRTKKKTNVDSSCLFEQSLVLFGKKNEFYVIILLDKIHKAHSYKEILAQYKGTIQY